MPTQLHDFHAYAMIGPKTRSVREHMQNHNR
jgi:hypothetical protein